MGCCKDTSTPLTAAAPQPWLHVNYAKGMVLGVDDLTQEFAYLSGRDQRAVRELLGYGTLSGLAVRMDDTPEGPRVRVTAGSAAIPDGRLVCVPGEQCALLNHWLAKPDNAARVSDLLHHASPPASPLAAEGVLSLWLTLCYADCTTLPVPIPGDPCRSEDQLMADSRIADDYCLELRTAPPPQVEEDALRDFVAWLRQVPLAGGSPPGPVDAALEQHWAEGVRLAAQPWLDLTNGSPPASPPRLDDYLFDSPPTGLAVAADQLAAFLRVALRVWVTELRPLWSARACSAEPAVDQDCVLLARLAVPVVQSGDVGGAWQVDGLAADVQVDESQRPFLVHGRLLQEWLSAAVEPGDAGLPTPLAGRLPVGDGGAWVGKTLVGTPDQISVSQGPATIALALPQPIAAASVPAFAGLTTTGAVRIAITTTTVNLALTDAHHCIVCEGGIALTLPKCGPDTLGRVYIVKCPGLDATLVCDAADTIDGAAAPLTVAANRAVTLVSNGVDTWHILSALA